MEVFVGRQVILDKNLDTYGYELLYRKRHNKNYFDHLDGNKATCEVLNNSFFSIGIDKLTGNKKAFINFTANLLEKQVVTIFDKSKVVVEILEDVKPKYNIIKACYDLKEKGYELALDDFIFSPEYLPLFEIVDYIKVDFMNTSIKERNLIVKAAKAKDITLLAEKIETENEFKTAVKQGYKYFQGYFFSRPKIISGIDIPTLPSHHLAILEVLNKKEVDFEKISQIIEKDIALSYKLLKLINSAAFSLRSEITSIKNVLTFLGTNELKKWLSIVIINNYSENKPLELIRMSVIRAKFSELLAKELGCKNIDKFFILGLFSLIDVLLERNLKDILDELPLSIDIKDALLGKEGILKRVYDLVLYYEKREWSKVIPLTNTLKLKSLKVNLFFLDSVKWSNQILSKY